MSRTLSEGLFEELCEQERWQYCRIPPRDLEGIPTPDYVIGGFWKRVAIEIKQLDPNPAEQEKEAALVAGSVVSFGGTPGDRVRKVINEGYDQIKSMTHGCWPGIIVVYDNIKFPHVHLDPYAIKVGMYGLEHILMVPSPDASLPSRIVDKVFGSKKKVGPKRDRALSAIARLFRLSADRIGLDVYHNCYARAPLAPKRLRSSSVRHYRLGTKQPGVGQDWELVS